MKRLNWSKFENRIASMLASVLQRQKSTKKICSWRNKLCSNKTASSLLNYITHLPINIMFIY